jgi:hypothetical protein
MKDRNVKQVILRGTTERGRVNEEGKGGWKWSMDFPCMYKYGTLKPIKVILRRGRGRERE